MIIKTRVPKTPPCMLMDTFPVVVYFDEKESHSIRRQYHPIIQWCSENWGAFTRDWGISVPHIPRHDEEWADFDADGRTEDELWVQLFVRDESAAAIFALRWLGN